MKPNALYFYPFLFTLLSDDTTHDTVFQTTKGDTLILRVHMPLGSSLTLCPAMSLAGVKARHEWLDSRMKIVGYDPIKSENAWRRSGLSLGQGVHAVVKQLQLYPPDVLEITDRGLEAIQSKQRKNGHAQSRATGAGSSNRAPPPHDAPPDYNTLEENGTAAVPDVPLPNIPLTYSELDSMSREEMDHLLEDELDFLSFVRNLKPNKELQKIGSSVLDENVKLAKSNLDYEDNLKQSQDEVSELQQKLKDMVSEFQQLEKQQNSVCAPPDKRDVIRQLNKAKRQAFDESEQVAEDWVESGGDVDDFVKEFLKQRVVHHQRAAKMEILQRSKDI